MPSNNRLQVATVTENEEEREWQSLLPESIRRTNPPFTHAEILRIQSLRPDVQHVLGRLLVPLGQQEKAIEELLESCKSEHEKVALRVNLNKELANASFTARRFDYAIEGYGNAIKSIMRDRSKPGFLLREFYNEDYLLALKSRPLPYQMDIFLNLVFCCNNIAQACMKLEDVAQAMNWTQEVEVLYECLKFNAVGTYPKIHIMRVPFLEFVTFRMKAALRYVYIFSQLGNTAAASSFTWRMAFHGCWFPMDIQEIKDITQQLNFNRVFFQRHPDPTRVDAWTVVYPQLQLRGIWSKLRVSSNASPPGMPPPDAWIWKSRIYVRWTVSSKISNEIWYLDLKAPARWKHLTPFPRIFFSIQPSFAKPLVYEDSVWFFAGSSEILRFNLVSEEWNSVRTTFDGKWPFRTSRFSVTATCIYSVERYRDKMCVFGGFYEDDSLFMLLDLNTLTWRRFNLAERFSKGTIKEALYRWGEVAQFHGLLKKRIGSSSCTAMSIQKTGRQIP